MNSIEIKALREELNLTQQELADKVGVHRITVTRWELGDIQPSPMAVQALNQLKQEAQK